MYLRVVTDDDNFARGFQLLVTTISDSGNEVLTKFTWNLISILEGQRNVIVQLETQSTCKVEISSKQRWGSNSNLLPVPLLS